MTNEYQEIKNEKDFNFEMLWSNIGGFIGIFAGYGLLQVLLTALDFMACLEIFRTKEDKLLNPIIENIIQIAVSVADCGARKTY